MKSADGMTADSGLAKVPAARNGNGNVEIDGPEYELAEKVQQLLLPKSSPSCTWCCIGIKNRMAAGLGGDYFDFIKMPDECQSLLIGDVTGHGLHASVVMSLIYGFIHRAAMGACDPLELVRQVNGFLIDFAERSQTLDQYFSSTLFYGIISPETLNMHFVNAGHVPALVLRDGAVQELGSTGPPIGFFRTPEMHLQTFRLEKNDRLLLYTDGIIEAANPLGELYGLDRLKRELLHCSSADHQEFLEILFKAHLDYSASRMPADDCSAIVIDIHGPFS
jgi:serine phosphatase RsbU (regulator of sigma subunit)